MLVPVPPYQKVFNVWHYFSKAAGSSISSKNSPPTPMSLMDEHLRINDPMHYFDYHYRCCAIAQGQKKGGRVFFPIMEGFQKRGGKFNHPIYGPEQIEISLKVHN